MILQKLTLNHLVAFVLGVFILGFLLYSGRVCLESIQKAVSVDENSLVSVSAQLNKQSLKKAVEILGEEKEETKLVKKAEEVKQEKKAEVKKIEIVNSSGVAGAAAELGSIFDRNEIEVFAKNGEEILDETVIFYKNGYRDYKNEIENKLKELGFSLDREEVLDKDSEMDIRVILGVNKEN